MQEYTLSLLLSGGETKDYIYIMKYGVVRKFWPKTSRGLISRVTNISYESIARVL